MESDVVEVALVSGVEELKRRLELLLGAKPHAAVEERDRRRRLEEAERLEQHARIAHAGGQLLSAAFTFLGEMLPKREETEAGALLARQFRDRLEECLDRAEHGRARLTVTLPDETAFDNLARSLASLLAPG